MKAASHIECQSDHAQSRTRPDMLCYGVHIKTINDLRNILVLRT